jgi:hypothetical protein
VCFLCWASSDFKNYGLQGGPALDGAARDGPSTAGGGPNGSSGCISPVLAPAWGDPRARDGRLRAGARCRRLHGESHASVIAPARGFDPAASPQGRHGQLEGGAHGQTRQLMVVSDHNQPQMRLSPRIPSPAPPDLHQVGERRVAKIAGSAIHESRRSLRLTCSSKAWCGVGASVTLP